MKIQIHPYHDTLIEIDWANLTLSIYTEYPDVFIGIEWCGWLRKLSIGLGFISISFDGKRPA